MSLSVDIAHIAALARLKLSEAEIAKFEAQLGQVLKYMEKLGSLDTTGVEPLMHPVALDAALRPDEPVSRPEEASAILECAPEVFHDSFKVPPIMKGGS